MELEADGDGTFRRYCDSDPCRRFTTFKTKKEDVRLRCEVCNVPVVRHHCDICDMVTFFEHKLDGYFYCERCEKEMVTPDFCCSADCNGALTILKWNELSCLFHCPQCDTLRGDVHRFAPPEPGSWLYRVYTHKLIRIPVIPPTPLNEEEVHDSPNLPSPPSEEVNNSPDLPTPPNEVDDPPPPAATKKKRRRPKVIPEYCFKPHVPNGELDPPLQATKFDSGFGLSKPIQGLDEQLPLVRTKQYKRRHR